MDIRTLGYLVAWWWVYNVIGSQYASRWETPPAGLLYD